MSVMQCSSRSTADCDIEEDIESYGVTIVTRVIDCRADLKSLKIECGVYGSFYEHRMMLFLWLCELFCKVTRHQNDEVWNKILIFFYFIVHEQAQQVKLKSAQRDTNLRAGSVQPDRTF